MAKPKFIGRCELTLKALLNDSSLSLEEVEKDSHRYSIIKRDGVGARYERDSDGRLRSLVPLNRGEPEFQLSFELGYFQARVDEVSLGVYTRIERQQLIRGEWSANSKGSTHAQPHWHTRLDDYVQSTNDGWMPDGFDDSRIRKYPVRKLHLAMAAQWHAKPFVHDHILATIPEEGVLNWVEGIVPYLQYQFSFKD